MKCGSCVEWVEPPEIATLGACGCRVHIACFKNLMDSLFSTCDKLKCPGTLEKRCGALLTAVDLMPVYPDLWQPHGGGRWPL